ncbi:MAG TPA: helix-turn-helix domain-containing protein [Actinomycetota bacterium]|nr:helix-turn-helix domain-containing protein [Actinomycetota bacterium]
MAEPVKPRRSYHSPRRQQQAAATRQAILEAAQRLFERRGYPATTMEQVAAEAGVALKTVYLAFATKSGLLRALWDLRLKGDQAEAAVAERPWYREVVEEPDPERQLRGNARNARLVKERIAGVLKILRSAAPVDPDAEALWRLIQTDFYDNQRVLVESLRARQALRPGLDVARASDILWTLNHPDVWLLLVGERGWAPEQWERWFADTACAQLLR